ncbi:hypothetical protein [Cognatilysobacter lacus]|uniref:Uncharacterized protein n=1 Tax=Cognatilysobacter lacus TaxID=1643323 RepID=A0A5D8ZA37_9GAMM|nr:hypothetical protein [Lysobacter lacus]TZF90982.1 hypothetical protein FW784_03230 [Lysobacter lacus]
MRPSLRHTALSAATVSLAAASLLLASPARAYTMRHCHPKTGDALASTAMVADLNPGAAGSTHPVFGLSSVNGLMTEFKSQLYFQADDGTHGAELWRVGTGAPSLVSDIAAGTAGSEPHAFATYDGALYFAAQSSPGHDVVYRTDGTTVTLAADPDAGAASQKVVIRSLIVYAGKLYFVRAADGVDRLWRYDGATVQLAGGANAAVGSFVTDDIGAHPFVVFKNRLYFVKAVGANYRLWAFDGNGATQVAQLVPDGNFTTYGFDLGAYGDALYFGTVVPADAPFVADELWKYTGSGAPMKVAGLTKHASSFSQPAEFNVFKGKLYFTGGAGLYRYDGTSLELLPGGAGGVPYGAVGLSPYSAVGSLYLGGFYDDWTSSEPYLFNGTTTTLVRDIMPPGAGMYAGSFPTRAVEVDDMLFFSADDGTHGRELWRMKRNDGPANLDCDIVVIPIWDDWRLWVVDEREVIVATWLTAPNQRPQLISRERAVVRRDQPLRVKGLQADIRRGRVADGARLVTRVYDVRTGAVLDRGEGAVGVSAQPVGREASAAIAVPQVGEPTLRDVMGQRVRGL